MISYLAVMQGSYARQAVLHCWQALLLQPVGRSLRAWLSILEHGTAGLSYLSHLVCSQQP